MSDVQIYYEELRSAASTTRSAGTEALTLAAELTGEDTGVENPASRNSLRLEFHRRLVALHDATANRAIASSDLAASIDAITNRFNDLDLELNGKEQS